MQNKKFDWLARFEQIPSRIYVFLAIFALALDTLLCAFTSVDPVICGTVTISVYAVVSLTIYLLVSKKLSVFKHESNLSEQQNENVIYTFRHHLKLPYAVITEQGRIVTVNAAFSKIVGAPDSMFDNDINTVCNINFSELMNALNQKNSAERKVDPVNYADIPIQNVMHAEIADIGDRKYKMDCYPLSSMGKSYFMLVFNDITELNAIYNKYKNEQTVVGYIVVDNIEEIAQYVKINYQDETRQIGKILSEWVEGMGGVLFEYENNKFITMFTKERLLECVRNKFSILSEIHRVEIGDVRVPMTISMGVAATGETLEERAHDAMISLDMALQRGGDQVVLKNPNGIFYFGAKTKTLQKRTRGHAKVIYARLAALIKESSNVLIMGHKNPDFDCIGACIGMTTLIRNMFKDKDVKIVADTHNDNFLTCTSRLRLLSEYKDTFIDGVSALEYNSAQTLIIVLDANNMAILESPELASNSFKIAIIDHHIKKEEYADEPNLCYIDASASSTCELISEMLEEILPADISFKEEANILLSGIMLDTKNFTRTAGIRTFAAAMYLKNAGAEPEYVRTFFEQEFNDYLSESQFGSKAKIYRDCIAIACETNAPDTNGRVLAAKASDKLLSIKDVKAAFALILIGNTVHISARSDGSINVQLIAERLGGGGHFDMAGVALSDTTPEEAERRLIEAIDAYFTRSDSPDTEGKSDDKEQQNDNNK